MFSVGLCFALLALWSCSSASCADAEVTVTVVTFEGRQGYRLSDGKTEAVVVPTLGRVMRFGRVGGENFLWNARGVTPKPKAWANWGGDKTWLAPQGHWPAYIGGGFPPDPAWDGLPHRATVEGQRVVMVSPESRTFGSRLTREFSYDANGDFVIRQTVKKTMGPPMMVSLWNVTQVPPDTAAAFMPLAEDSAYKNNFHWYGKKHEGARVTVVSPTLLRYQHSVGAQYKIGADAPVSAIAAVRGDLAFVERAEPTTGHFPDGAQGAGFPVELYNGGNQVGGYTELELLSPLRPMKSGDSFSHTLRWSIHPLPSADATSEETAAEVEKLLHLPWPGAEPSE